MVQILETGAAARLRGERYPSPRGSPTLPGLGWLGKTSNERVLIYYG